MSFRGRASRKKRPLGDASSNVGAVKSRFPSIVDGYRKIVVPGKASLPAMRTTLRVGTQMSFVKRDGDSLIEK